MTLTKPTPGGDRGTWGAKLNAALDTLDRRTPFLTPEDYGAVGDGTTDDTTAFQSWLNALASTGAKGVLAGKTYRITSTLTIPDSMSIEGVGCWASTGDYSVGSVGTGPGIPWSAPYLKGSVLLWDCTTGASMFVLGKQAINLRFGAFGVRCATLWSSTSGHIFDFTPPGDGNGNGLVGSRFWDVWVFGHGGNHYGWLCINAFNNTYENVRAVGGGGIKFKDTNNGWNYGNSVVYNPLFKMIAAGTAHILHIAGPGHGTQYSLIHPQLIAMDPARYNFVGTAPTNAQKLLLVDSGAVLGLSIVAPDFENAGTTCSYQLPEQTGDNWGQFLDPGGYTNAQAGTEHAMLSFGNRGGFLPRNLNNSFAPTSASAISDTSLTQNWLCDTSSGAYTITLPTSLAGKQFTIKNTGANTLTVAGKGTDTIDGSNTLTLTQNQAVTVVCSGTGKWYVTQRA